MQIADLCISCGRRNRQMVSAICMNYWTFYKDKKEGMDE